jgi:carbamoyltransferase
MLLSSNCCYYLYKKQPRLKSYEGIDQMQGSFLGPRFEQDDIEKRLKKLGADFKSYSESEMLSHCAQALAQGKVVGWFLYR